MRREWQWSGVIDGEAEVVSGFGDRFGTSDDHVWFITVQFDEVGLHSGFDISETVDQSGVSCSGDGFGDVELDIGSVVDVKAMVMYDVTKESM